MSLPKIEKDAQQYIDIGRNVILGSYAIEPGIPTLHRLPGYPLFLAAVIYFFGGGLLPILLCQALLDTLACYVIYRLTQAILPETTHNWIRYVPAFIYALYPSAVLVAKDISSEFLFNLYLVLSFYFLTRFLRDRRNSTAFISGSFFALADLTRGGLVFFMIMISVLLMITRVSPRQVLICLLGYLILFSPWVIRNKMVFNSFVYYSTLGGKALWSGNNPYSKGYYPPVASPEFQKFLEEHPEFVEYERRYSQEGLVGIQADRAYRRLARAYLMEHPAEFIKNIPRKLFQLYWAPYLPLRSQLSKPAKVVLELIHLGVLGAGILGFAIGRWRQKHFFYSFCVYWTTMHLLIYGSPRFAFPMMFLFILSVGPCLERITCRASLARRGGGPVPAGRA